MRHTPDDILLYDTSHAELIRDRDPEAVRRYVHHPAGAFPLAFIRHTADVDARGAARVYVNSIRTLERLVCVGEVRNPGHLRRLGEVVLRTYGLHHARLAYHRDRPLLPPDGAVGIDGEPVRRPLFAAGADTARLAAAEVDPAGRLVGRELLAAALGEARSIGRLHVKVYSGYRRFEFEAGTPYGAYVYIARAAVLDARGRVVDIGSWRAARPATRPPARVVRQVRAIHLEARDRVHAAARRLGYPVPPGA